MKTQILFPFEEEAKQPPGFLFLPDFITPAEEVKLLNEVKKLDFQSFEMYGVEAKRKIVHYGYHYDFYSRSISKSITIPGWLNDLKARSEKILNEEIAEVLVTHYPIMSGIGWHVDAPAFESLLGLSLLGSCRWQMRKGEPKNWEKFEMELEPRSAYVVKDEARWKWQHHIPDIKQKGIL